MNAREYEALLDRLGMSDYDRVEEIVAENEFLREALRTIVRSNDPKQGGMFCNFCEAAEIAERALNR